MGVQFNLLPDVKLEYIKARRMKRTVVTVSVICSVIAVAIFLVLFLIVNVLQTRHINNLTEDIEQGVAEIKQIQDIDKVLTVQNQLNSLTGLHEKKPATDRALGYISQITPAQANISDVNIDFASQTVTIAGSADNLATVNKFADTIKFTTYTGGVESQPNAFSEVVLTSFSVDEESVTYELEMKYNPEIFDNTRQIELVIPETVTTRSQIEKPSELFGGEGGAQ